MHLLASIDNLDKLFSKKLIRTGDTLRCWNGTTINGYNPMPNSLKEDSVMPNIIGDNLNAQVIIPETYEHSNAESVILSESVS